MKIAIIYHDADFDGKFSREVCLHHLKRLHPRAGIETFGWDYGKPVPPESVLMEFSAIYIVDLSVPEIMDHPGLRERTVWIDHHKSAMEVYVHPGKYKFQGMRIDGVAACRLCHNWFLTLNDTSKRADKQDFIDRKVEEPLALRLAGEYDIWDHRDPRGKPFQFGLRTLPDNDFHEFAQSVLSDPLEDTETGRIVTAGWAIKNYVDSQSEAYAKDYAHTVKFHGLTVCALNAGQRGNSDLFNGGLQAEHDACFSWRYTGKDVMVSLYHAPGKTHLDLSQIAVKYGGGGHRGACGFRVSLARLEGILAGCEAWPWETKTKTTV